MLPARHKPYGPWLRALGLCLAALAPTPVRGETSPAPSALSWDASYTADFSTVAEGAETGSRFTGIGRVSADLALEPMLGWTGARLHAQALVSSGDRPNDLAGTLQGVNNIEVAENRAKLFEFYLEQQFAADRASLRLGFADLNAEFYATEASGLLIAPAFGIGSELSATGPRPLAVSFDRADSADQTGSYQAQLCPGRGVQRRGRGTRRSRRGASAVWQRRATDRRGRA